MPSALSRALRSLVETKACKGKRQATYDDVIEKKNGRRWSREPIKRMMSDALQTDSLFRFRRRGAVESLKMSTAK